MGANMNIDIYTRKTIGFSRVIDFLNKKGIFLTIENVEIIKDWEFTDCRKLSVEIDEDMIIQELNKNNIILIYAIANKNINCGVQIEHNKYGFYEYGFYFDTNLIGIYVHYINKHSLILYNRITDAVKELIDSRNLIICGIGEETSVVSHDNIDVIIQKSSSLERWILPSEVKINNYIQSKNSEFYIYDNKGLLVVNY